MEIIESKGITPHFLKNPSPRVDFISHFIAQLPQYVQSSDQVRSQVKHITTFGQLLYMLGIPLTILEFAELFREFSLKLPNCLQRLDPTKRRLGKLSRVFPQEFSEFLVKKHNEYWMWLNELQDQKFYLPKTALDEILEGDRIRLAVSQLKPKFGVPIRETKKFSFLKETVSKYGKLLVYANGCVASVD